MNKYDDPRLTAYILGELEDDQRREFERLLEQDAGLRAELESLRAASDLLSQELADPPQLRLDPERREEILESAAPDQPWFILRYRQEAMALAASLVIALGLFVALPSTKEPAGEVDGFLDTTQSANSNEARPPAQVAEQMAQEARRTIPASDDSARPFPQRQDERRIAESQPDPAKLRTEDEGDRLTRKVSAPSEPKAEEREAETALDTAERFRQVVRKKDQDSASLSQLPESLMVRPVGGRSFDGPVEVRDLASGVVGGVPGGIITTLPDSPQPAPVDRESYSHIEENAFQRAVENPLSTFSIDVDTASYSNVRRFLQAGRRPPRDAVRIEELINYFRYEYPQPSGQHPFSVNTRLMTCPWQPRHYLLRVGLQGYSVDESQRPASNLVFLIDTSGSMASPNKLPLLQQAFRLLAQRLRPEDRVAIVTYAGSAGLVLPSTPGSRSEQIAQAIERLRSGGSTAGASGIRLAYQTARQHFIEDGINRVLLATDGDFNVGISSEGELVEMIEGERESGVFLTVLGFGGGNLQDSKMEQLANHGNGQYAYIDSLREAQKVLVEDMGGSLMTIAKDVKIQVEFNPLEVGAYRLIGYENRQLQAQDFNDDRKDAGEIGAGHSVTALYEIVPAGLESELPSVDGLRYQRPTVPTAEAAAGELATVKLRYKRPQESSSLLLQEIVPAYPLDWRAADTESRFAASVAVFGMLLRQSPHMGQADWNLADELAGSSIGYDPYGHRAEFLSLLRTSKHLLAPPQGQ
ncbi:MAG TPA: von Willebrand factor type A domain-containing protein [Acidobacteriota bacterium]|nr:von Willebrand factor type A domain-containing protein [Acidobacteriota bacterium]